MKGLFLAMIIALACTAAQAEMPHDQKYYENETVYKKLSNEVEREYYRTMAQCNLDTDRYIAEYPVHLEYGTMAFPDELKLRDKTTRRRYSLCMNAAGWPSPFPEDVGDSTVAFTDEKFRRVQEKWEASGKDVQWLGAYVAEWRARHQYYP